MFDNPVFVVILLVVVAALGAAAGFFAGRSKGQEMARDAKTADLNEAKAQIEADRQEISELSTAVTQYRTQAEGLAQQLTYLKSQLAQAQRAEQERVERERERAAAEAERKQAENERKLQEQYLALEIEKQMTKEEILEAYMNTINLGQNCLGVQSAAKRYFNKDVSELTLSECAVIAGITQNPTRYDPVTHPEENAKRRDIVLNNMLEQGYITQQEFDEAKADPVYDRIQPTAVGSDAEKPNTYFIDELAEQILNDLQERKSYTATQAHNLLYSGGLTIYATQDPTIQQICDEEVADPSNYPSTIEYGLQYALTVTRADGSVENYSQNNVGDYIQAAWGREYPLVFSSPDEANQAVAEYKTTLNIQEGDTVDESITIPPQPQTSVVLMDQYTGEVKAIVGGRGEKTASFSLNRATDSYRQPGSCFKPLGVYAPAIDTGKYTLASLIEDSPYTYSDGTPVNNWDGKYIGQATVRYAILHSMNVCAVRTLTDIGIDTGMKYLENFGFTTLVSKEDDPAHNDYNQSTALGGITNGVYNIELTAAYAALANNGVYTKPILYTKVLDHDGNVILDNSTPETHQVVKDFHSSTSDECYAGCDQTWYRYSCTACKWNACIRKNRYFRIQY